MNNKVVCEDSSIFLAELFKNQRHKSHFGAIDKCQQRFQFERCLPPTVKNEVDCRISTVINFLGTIYRKFGKYLKAKTDKLNPSDPTIVSKFFDAINEKYSDGSTEREIAQRIRSDIIKHLKTMTKPQNTDDFILDTLVEFDEHTYRLQQEYIMKCENYKVFSATINPTILKKLNQESSLKRTSEKKANDIKILCEIEAYQRDSEKTCLLVTVDAADFLNNADIIKRLIGVKCVDPLHLCQEFETAQV